MATFCKTNLFIPVSVNCSEIVIDQMFVFVETGYFATRPAKNTGVMQSSKAGLPKGETWRLRIFGCSRFPQAPSARVRRRTLALVPRGSAGPGHLSNAQSDCAYGLGADRPSSAGAAAVKHRGGRFGSPSAATARPPARTAASLTTAHAGTARKSRGTPGRRWPGTSAGRTAPYPAWCTSYCAALSRARPPDSVGVQGLRARRRTLK